MANVKNINKIISKINSINPNNMIMRALETDSDHGCKTAACITGWTCITFKRGTSFDIAAELLEINEDNAARLFYLDSYEDKATIERTRDALKTIGGRDPLFHGGYDYDVLNIFDSLPAERRQRITIKVLEHLRDTNEVDWAKAIQEA